jgi:hypothetical protein
MSKPIWICCCLALFAAGCSGTNPPLTPNDNAQSNLTQIGELCRFYQFGKSKPPAKLEDLATLKTQGANGYEALRSGAVILRFGATLPDLSEDPGQSPSEEVLAYLKEVPESGGKVLLLNRTIKTMTPEEFKAAKLAGTSSSAESKPAAK